MLWSARKEIRGKSFGCQSAPLTRWKFLKGSTQVEQRKKKPDDPFQTKKNGTTWSCCFFKKKCPKQTKYGVFYQFNLSLYILKQLKNPSDVYDYLCMWSCNSVGRRLQVLHLQHDLVGNQKLLATPLCYIVEMHIMHICQIWIFVVCSFHFV